MDKLSLEWQKTHLKNLIWSAKNKNGLFGINDIPRFENKLKELAKNE